MIRYIFAGSKSRCVKEVVHPANHLPKLMSSSLFALRSLMLSLIFNLCVHRYEEIMSKELYVCFSRSNDNAVILIQKIVNWPIFDVSPSAASPHLSPSSALDYLSLHGVLPILARRSNSSNTFNVRTFNKVILTSKRGREVIPVHNLNKGTAFTVPERQQLVWTGLVPSRMHDISSQIDPVMLAYENCTNNLDRYSFLSGLKQRNVVLYYMVLIENLKNSSRIIYTPTVSFSSSFPSLY